MKYFLIAGEASGDLHASELIRELKKQDPKAQFAFLGGDLMAKASGQQPVIHYRDMAFMGFTDVIRHAGKISRNFKAARQAIDDFKPDRLILIDYPSFNLKMAEYAKKKGIKVVCYISPKVWAWKEWRVKTIKKVVDQMLCIFPFEVKFYAKHGYKVEYVGNASVEEVDRKIAEAADLEHFLAKNNLQNRPIVALLPGSRLSEIKVNLPIMEDVMRRFPQYRGVVAGAPGIDPEVYSQYTTLPVVFDQTYDLLRHARAALVTSGTAILETALAGVPQVAMFRHNGSKLMHKLKDWVLSVEFVTLPNLIVGREIIPELLLEQCTADAVAEHLGRLLPERPPRQQMLSGYAQMRQSLGILPAARAAARAILRDAQS